MNTRRIVITSSVVIVSLIILAIVAVTVIRFYNRKVRLMGEDIELEDITSFYYTLNSSALPPMLRPYSKKIT